MKKIFILLSLMLAYFATSAQNYNNSSSSSSQSTTYIINGKVYHYESHTNSNSNHQNQNQNQNQNLNNNNYNNYNYNNNNYNNYNNNNSNRNNYNNNNYNNYNNNNNSNRNNYNNNNYNNNNYNNNNYNNYNNNNSNNYSNNNSNNNSSNRIKDENSNYQYFNTSQVQSANTAANCSYLTREEKLAIFYCNLARIDGDAFYKEFLPNIGKNSYEQSLISDLKSTKNQPLLYPAQGLYNAAKAHCNDMNRNNFFAHSSKNGTGTFDRIKQYYNESFACAENIAAGYSTGFETVRQWLIDENTPSLGHRKSILNQNNVSSSKIGVACSSHPTYSYCWTMDFAE